MTETAYAAYVGIDWGTATHQVAVLDAQRAPLGERAVAHDGAALQAFTEWLTLLTGGEPARVAVGLEVPRGAVVDTLLERGFHVFALNPKQLDRFRDRYTVAGAKDDRRDAFVLATALATDRPAFRRLEFEAPLIVELREWSRVEDELREEWGRLANRLREQLHRFSPQLLALCPAADEPWFWALIALAPTPLAAQRLRRAAVVTLLREHRIRRLSADQVLAVLRSTPLRVAPGTVEAASAHVALLIPRLELIDRQRRDCARRIEQLLDALATTGEHQGHRDVTILRSLPGVGRVVAATMLAEASRLLAARDYHGLRTQAGVAPVTRQSGKRLLVGMRYACNPRLRNALYYWGFISVRHDAHSRRRFVRQRHAGQHVDRLDAIDELAFADARTDGEDHEGAKSRSKRIARDCSSSCTARNIWRTLDHYRTMAWGINSLFRVIDMRPARPPHVLERIERQRRADALALLAESSVRSYPSWVAELKRKLIAGSLAVIRLNGITDVHLILQQAIGCSCLIRRVRCGADNENSGPGNVILPKLSHRVV